MDKVAELMKQAMALAEQNKPLMDILMQMSQALGLVQGEMSPQTEQGTPEEQMSAPDNSYGA